MPANQSADQKLRAALEKALSLINRYDIPRQALAGLHVKDFDDVNFIREALGLPPAQKAYE